MNSRLTRVLLVDDHEVVRRGLRSLIESHNGFVVCGETGDGRAAIDVAVKMQPDVVVMDVGMPSLNGFEATRSIREKVPEATVLILSMHDSEVIVREVFAAGARGYVLKSDAARDLIAAIEELRDGKVFLSPKIADLVSRGIATTAAGRRRRKENSALTNREREVLQLLAEGFSNRKVAKALGISIKTAETHRARVMQKIGAKSIADLVRYAIRNGFVTP